MNSNTIIHTKVTYAEDIRRFSCEPVLSTLQATIKTLFGFDDTPFVLKYVDDEKDLCTISTQLELDYAVSHSPLRLKVIKTSVPEAGEPVLASSQRVQFLKEKLAFVQTTLQKTDLPPQRVENLNKRKAILEWKLERLQSPDAHPPFPRGGCGNKDKICDEEASGCPRRGPRCGKKEREEGCHGRRWQKEHKTAEDESEGPCPRRGHGYWRHEEPEGPCPRGRGRWHREMKDADEVPHGCPRGARGPWGRHEEPEGPCRFGGRRWHKEHKSSDDEPEGPEGPCRFGRGHWNKHEDRPEGCHGRRHWKKHQDAEDQSPEGPCPRGRWQREQKFAEDAEGPSRRGGRGCWNKEKCPQSPQIQEMKTEISALREVVQAKRAALRNAKLSGAPQPEVEALFEAFVVARNNLRAKKCGKRELKDSLLKAQTLECKPEPKCQDAEPACPKKACAANPELAAVQNEIVALRQLMWTKKEALAQARRAGAPKEEIKVLFEALVIARTNLREKQAVKRNIKDAAWLKQD